MRVTGLVFAVALSVAGSASAQDWEQYTSIQDGFKIDFPGQPKITTTTYKSEYGYDLPARVYSVEKGKEKYSMMVVDYTGIEKMGIERAAKCPPGAEPCRGQLGNGGLGGVIGPAYSTQDIRGALVYASFQFIKRDVKITHYLWNWEDLVEGHEIHMTNNADQSRTMAFIAMRQNHLYVMEGTVPKGYPEPGLFYQSLGWVDKQGNGVRYQQIYVNEIYGLGLYPEPGYGGQFQGGQGQGQGQGQDQGQGQGGGRGAGRGAGAPPAGRQ